MKGRVKRRVKKIILWSITYAALLTLLLFMSGCQVWNGTEWVEPDFWFVAIPITISAGWLILFGKVNHFI